MKRSKNYSRVSSRVNSFSRPILRSDVSVTSHEIRSSKSVGAKPAVPKVTSGGFYELPTVLNDYVPGLALKRIKPQTIVTKPRKTIRSLDPALSPPRIPLNIQKHASIRVPHSAPTFFRRQSTTDHRERECNSSRSYKTLHELKTEIKAHEETEKLMKLRSRLHKSCGITLDESGNPAENKAVQVTEKGLEPSEFRYE